MKKSQRLKVVLDLAQRKEDDAAAACEKIKIKLHHEQERLTELREYYQEYQQQFDANMHQIRPSDLINRRNFLNQLSLAQDSQRQTILNIESAYTLQKRVWRECYMKRQAMKDLISRYQEEESVENDRREQKLMDDWVSQVRLR